MLEAIASRLEAICLTIGRTEGFVAARGVSQSVLAQFVRVRNKRMSYYALEACGGPGHCKQFITDATGATGFEVHLVMSVFGYFRRAYRRLLG